MSCSRVIGICVVLAAAVWTVGADGAWFMPLPQLPGSVQGGDAMAVSADGSTIVGNSHDGNVFHAVRWTIEPQIMVQTLGVADFSFAWDVSGDGQTIVGYRAAPGVLSAFRWTPATGPIPLGDFPGAEEASRAFGVSADGNVVVGIGRTAEVGEAFRWTSATGLVSIGDLPGGAFGSEASSISADGMVIVGSGLSNRGTEAFRWTAKSGMVGLGDLPGGGFYSEAFDVSANGSVVVGNSAGTNAFSFSAFRWTAETGMVALPRAANEGAPSLAQAVSGDGSVIVGGLNTGDHAFAWDSYHGTRIIAELLASQGVNLEGWTLKVARGISADGLTIAGQGFSADSRALSPWVARLDPGTFVPEPSAIGLGAVAILMAIGWWRWAGLRA